MRSRTTPIIVLGILAGAAITMACGSSSAQSISTPAGDVATSAPQATATTQPVATPTDPPPAATSTPVAVATPTAAPAAAVPAAPPPPPAAPVAPPPASAGSTTVTLDLGDNFFSSKEVTVPAGVPITVTINNQGQALHNWDVTGVVKSTFIQHGQSQTVTFTAAPGTYAFQCDVHPKEMTGVLIVK